MSLNSSQLDAFVEVARKLSFSKAAKTLHVTQSALSQRIANLEEELGLTLFIRKPGEIALTEPGQRLLRYCQTREVLEGELLDEIAARPASGGLAGELRVGGFSSVTRSVLLPALAPLLRENPRIQLHLFSAEMRELPALLQSGEADLIVLDSKLERDGVESALIGEERNVMIEGRDPGPRGEVMLDHDPDDLTTERFFRLQGGKAPKYARTYLDEIHAILDGVALGVGRAIAPRHLVTADSRVREVPGYKPLITPVYLHYFAQPFYSRLQLAAREALLTRAPKILSGKGR